MNVRMRTTHVNLPCSHMHLVNDRMRTVSCVVFLQLCELQYMWFMQVQICTEKCTCEHLPSTHAYFQQVRMRVLRQLCVLVTMCTYFLTSACVRLCAYADLYEVRMRTSNVHMRTLIMSACVSLRQLCEVRHAYFECSYTYFHHVRMRAFCATMCSCHYAYLV